MTVRKYSSRSQQTTLTSAITSGATVIPVASASALLGGATINSGETFVIVIDPDTALEEIVQVTTAPSSNNLTVTRAVDMAGASAQDHSAGAVVRHMIIGRDLRESNLHIEATTGYNDGTGTHTLHGLSAADGNVVGAAATQTLTNKTLTTPTINGATLSGTITSTATVSGGTITGAAVTGLSAPSAGSDATTKTYVDSILGSATAASTSATSAAASATAAATSAASAATSASAALASQTAAATSATSAAASATAAATSATSASTQATAAATSATSAAASATAAATSATSAAASATAAASSATTAAASVATIATYASNALTSANSAATSATAAATSAASAAASTSAAATSAASAATSATAAATSATSAAASATAAATSAASAATAVSTVATSATSAANSATAAATSASSAATSASSAATSASNAATTYDNFDDRYLGNKATAPTVDNDGNTLLVGAMYWNSTSNAMYVWSGSSWVQTANTTTYTAPTLGSTLISSGNTISNVADLTINSTTIPYSKTLVDTNSTQTLSSKTLDNGLATGDPTVALGIATKQYVDSVTTGINFHAPVVAASTNNLNVTYSNGSSGVGATLTADTLRAFNTLDGTSVSVGNRVLIKDQTNQIQNGIYTLTNNGSAGVTAWVLTRATDADNNPAGEMANGDVVNTTGGTVNTGKTFVNATPGTITIGTTNITYSAYYAGLPAQSGNAGSYLTTDGTTPSWAAASGETFNPLLLMGA